MTLRGSTFLAAPVLALACLSCAGAAAPCFSQSSLVLDTRVLAVRVDPPESVVDLSRDDPLPSSNLSALAVTAAYGPLLEYGRAIQVSDLHTTLSLCLPPSISDVNAQPGCPAGSPVIGELDSVPSLDAPFAITPPMELLQQAVAQDPVHGLAGVQLRLQLSFDLAPGNITVTKALSYQLKGSPVSLNHGLELVGMETSKAGAHITLLPGQAIDLIVAQTTGLRPLIAPGAGAASAIETYLAYDNTGHLTQFQEHITYAFYAGNALFFGTPTNGPEAIYTGAAGDVADEPAPGSEDPPDGLATVEPVFIGSQGGSFWVIARDGRGAEAWAHIPYYATDVRPCSIKTSRYDIPHCPNVFFGCN